MFTRIGRSFMLASLVTACGTSAAPPPTTQVVLEAPARPPTPPPSSAPEPPRAPSAGELLLASFAEGTALLAVDVADEGDPRVLVVLGPSEVTPSMDGETHVLGAGGFRLEDTTPLVTPHTLELPTEAAACSLRLTSTSRVEAWAEEDAPVHAAWVAEGTLGCDDFIAAPVAFVGGAPSSERLSFDNSANAADARRQIARLPRGLAPRPGSRDTASFLDVEGATILVAYSAPDEDGCAYDEITYVVRADGSAEGMLGSTDGLVVHYGGTTYVVVVRAGANAGRSAQHVRLVSLAPGVPSPLDTDVALQWSAGPSC